MEPSPRLNAKIAAIVAALFICGCLPFLVVLGGGLAWVFLYGQGYTATDLGLKKPDFQAPDFLDRILSGQNAPEPQAGQPSDQGSGPQPSTQGGIPQPQGTAQSGDLVQAGKDCAKLGTAVPQYKLLSSTINDRRLVCGFGREGSYSFEVVVAIKEYATPGDASQAWASEWGSDSDYATRVQADLQSTDRFTFLHEGDHFFTTYRNNEEAGVTTYDVTAGRLYDNAVIEFTCPKAPDATASTWIMLETQAMDLVNEHNAQ